MSKKKTNTKRQDNLASDLVSSGSNTLNQEIVTLIKSMFNKLNKSVCETLTEVKNEVCELKKTVEFVSEKFDSLKSEILALKDEVKTVKSEITSLKSENLLLRFQMQDLQQYSRRGNIVINGIPETSNENVYDVLDNVADIIQAKDLNNSISVAHRLPTRMKGKERPIVVRFAFRHSRNEWIRRFKEEASHDSSGLGISLK
ncbi:hypothetical protein C0J52_07490 [Blattella germanica]|nr:hypothetical protein C0J52_07490 [Blattella germanica]